MKITIDLDDPYLNGLRRQARDQRMSLERYIALWAKGSVRLRWSVGKSRLSKNLDYTPQQWFEDAQLITFTHPAQKTKAAV